VGAVVVKAVLVVVVGVGGMVIREADVDVVAAAAGQELTDVCMGGCLGV
jgi:hypothetical protein